VNGARIVSAIIVAYPSNSVLLPMDFTVSVNSIWPTLML
jgi:hypothetical protein